MFKKIVPNLILILVLVMLVSACTPAATPTPVVEKPATAVPAASGNACMDAATLDAKIGQYKGGYDRPSFTTTKPSKDIKIAYLAYENNPFWEMQKVGMQNAIDDAKKAGLPLTVDFNVVSEKLDPTLMVAAIENAVVQKYDAIYMFPINEAIQPAIQKAVDAGVKVGFIASDYQGSTKTIAIGQDLFNAGKMAGYLMIKQTGGKGKVGIVTGQFG